MDADLERYHRQVILPEIGVEGQRRLLASKVVVVGCGALGTVSAPLLARAGVGHLTLVDRDFVERTNLQRQLLYDEDDVASSLPKAEAAAAKLRRANPDITIDAVVVDVNRDNVERLLAGASLVIDGADNFELRFLVNEACVKHGIPWVHAAAVATTGMQLTIIPGVTPCYACIVETAPDPGVAPTCDTAGVLAPAVAMVVCHQVTEALKILTANTKDLRGTLLSVDVWTNLSTEIEVKRRTAGAGCPVCVQRRFDHLEGRAGATLTSLCGRNAIQVGARPGGSVAFAEVAARVGAVARVTQNRFLMRFQVDGLDVTLFADGRAIVQGTDDATRARAVLAKYVGT
ncbi:MAG: ThiF family adenylyltransferase [Deltaproteobacteria bacterium]|nr:ThiF family adenylyltransferase [Deltaproteobacteria bacterium]